MGMPPNKTELIIYVYAQLAHIDIYIDSESGVYIILCAMYMAQYFISCSSSAASPSQLNGKGDVSIRLPWDGLARYWISQLEAHTPVSFVECMRRPAAQG